MLNRYMSELLCLDWVYCSFPVEERMQNTLTCEAAAAVPFARVTPNERAP